jgi:hypothetical protein
MMFEYLQTDMKNPDPITKVKDLLESSYMLYLDGALDQNTNNLERLEEFFEG